MNFDLTCDLGDVRVVTCRRGRAGDQLLSLQKPHVRSCTVLNTLCQDIYRFFKKVIHKFVYIFFLLFLIPIEDIIRCFNVLRSWCNNQKVVWVRHKENGNNKKKKLKPRSYKYFIEYFFEKPQWIENQKKYISIPPHPPIKNFPKTNHTTPPLPTPFLNKQTKNQKSNKTILFRKNKQKHQTKSN